MDRNSAINILLIAATAFLTYEYSYWFLLTPIIFHIINDFSHWMFGWTIFDEEVLVQRGYKAVDAFLDLQAGQGLDLGFNFYDGDLNRKREEAQKIKWDFMLGQLKLEAGDKLIDIGCGYGDWLRHAKSKGIEVVGVNITKPQADHAHEKYDLDIKNVNWKQILKDPALQKELFGRFDAVTFMDTIEHFVPSTARNKPAVQAEIYDNMFYLASCLLNPVSKKGRLFLSCLHQIPKKWDLHRTIAVYTMNRTMSGYYPIGEDALIKHSRKYFTELERIDRTEDYRLTGALEQSHFQGRNNVQLTAAKVWRGLQYLFLDPYFVHRLIGAAVDNWMALFGPNPYERKYDPVKRARETYVRLLMCTLEAKKS